MEGSGPGSKADGLTHSQKMRKITVETDATQIMFYEWSEEYRLGISFLEKNNKKITQ